MKCPIVKLYDRNLKYKLSVWWKKERKLKVVEHEDIVDICELGKGVYVDEREEENFDEEFVE